MKDRAKTTTEKHKQKCLCIFCNSHCPGCGSPNISVEFIVSYKSNKKGVHFPHLQRKLHRKINGNTVKLKCSDCDRSFDSMKDKRLRFLRNALKEFIPSEGDTMFRYLRCPKCRSKQTSIILITSYEYINKDRNHFHIYRDYNYDTLTLQCHKCDKSIDFIADKKLNIRSFDYIRCIPRNIYINIDDDGEMTFIFDGDRELYEDDDDDDFYDDDELEVG